ncbi:shikimate kinase [Paenibacillus sp. 1001270B_150601_E10]|uniref:shikimate kinase n=1 Tax=Paenibacillus sp. 1001270B_150601_E10 TaxID=2787079 RepID=UPI001E5D19E7|nr:shikimate kinase [Paenibacillus sp. 1001270B_150601_E10]
MLTNERRELRHHIVLIGFMGTGKSIVGQRLAERLHVPFIDLDQEVVRQEGRSIPELFAQEGEEYFRDTESKVLAAWLQSEQPGIISTGGGAVLRAINCDVMKQQGFVVALTAEVDTIIARVSGDADRPLLQGNASERVHQLMEARAGRYDFAHCTIPTDQCEVEHIMHQILEAYETYRCATKEAE